MKNCTRKSNLAILNNTLDNSLPAMLSASTTELHPKDMPSNSPGRDPPSNNNGQNNLRIAVMTGVAPIKTEHKSLTQPSGNVSIACILPNIEFQGA